MSNLVRLDEANKAKRQFHDSYFGSTKGEEYIRYLRFSQFIQRIFISEGGYIVDTGNFETVNGKLMDLIEERIKKHPILWRLFFMVA